jgi:flagellar hook assembly protein FlgD
MEIYIFNLTGKLIKTITKSELGNLKIGHNMSDYAWDGTDEFGDRLANGVYLYKVVTKLNGQMLDLRQDGNEAMFKNDVGKLYLMR